MTSANYKYKLMKEGATLTLPDDPTLAQVVRGTIRWLDGESYVASYDSSEGADGFLIKLNFINDTILADCRYLRSITDEDHWFWVTENTYNKYMLSRQVDSILDDPDNNDIDIELLGVDKLTRRGIL